MPRPCEAQHPVPRPEGCVVCRKFLTDARYRRLWSDPKPRMDFRELAARRRT